MSVGTRVKKEHVLETLVTGICPSCTSQEITISRFLDSNKLYTNISCRNCKFEDSFQARPEDHLGNKHVF